jgi:hypothetical protein
MDDEAEMCVSQLGNQEDCVCGGEFGANEVYVELTDEDERSFATNSRMLRCMGLGMLGTW